MLWAGSFDVPYKGDEKKRSRKCFISIGVQGLGRITAFTKDGYLSILKLLMREEGGICVYR